MTVIAVRITTNEISLAADSQNTYGHNKFNSKDLGSNNSKLFSVNGITAGIAGSVAESCLFQIFCKTHKPAQATIDSLMDFMVEFASWGKDRSADFKPDNHYILIFQKKVFLIMQAILVKNVDKFMAVGSGMFLALGAMEKGATPSEGVEIAKKYDLYCGGDTEEMTIITTD